MVTCQFAGGLCLRCGAPMVSPRQVCGSWSPEFEVGRLPMGGPGTELTRLLASVGIAPADGCRCYARAAEMDRLGVEWCADNLGTICGWLQEEAEKRGLPFLELAARLLVRRAIANARK